MPRVVHIHEESGDFGWEIKGAVGMAREKETMEGAIEVIAADEACGIDAERNGFMAGVVRFDKRRAECTVRQTHEATGHAARVNVSAGAIAEAVNEVRRGR